MMSDKFVQDWELLARHNCARFNAAILHQNTEFRWFHFVISKNEKLLALHLLDKV